MKRILAAILWLAFAASAFAVNVQFAWDTKPAGDTRTTVRVYERSGAVAPFTYTLVGSALEPATMFTLNNVPVGVHTYIARGWNGQSESVDSNAVSTSVLTVPGAVTTVTITFVP